MKTFQLILAILFVFNCSSLLANNSIKTPPCTATTATVYDTSCQGSNLNLAGYGVVSISGVYTGHLINAKGCDSIITYYIFFYDFERYREDKDGDGHPSANPPELQLCRKNGVVQFVGGVRYIPFSIAPLDYNDSDPYTWNVTYEVYVDADKDGYCNENLYYTYLSSGFYYGDSLPSGISATWLPFDCDDNDPTKDYERYYYIDKDGDKYVQWVSYFKGCLGTNPPYPYILSTNANTSAGEDCNDNNYNVTTLSQIQSNLQSTVKLFGDSVITSGTPVSFDIYPVPSSNDGTQITYYKNNVWAYSTYDYLPPTNYLASNLNNGDKISCAIYFTMPCGSLNYASVSFSTNTITMHVSPVALVTPTLSISATDTVICNGMPVTFTATGVNHGTTPVYQWKINGVNTGGNSSTFTYNLFNNGDVVTCTLTSSLVNANPPTINSNIISMQILPTSTTAIAASICSGSSYSFNGNSYTTSGIYTARIPKMSGCDSLVILTLNVNPNTSSLQTVTICSSSLPYSWNGTAYTSSGTFIKHLTNSKGCDSAATLILNVTNTSTSTTNITKCSNQLPYIWNGISVASAGTTIKHLTNSKGCDSAATLILTVKNTSTSSTSVSICSSQLPYLWNGISRTTAGTYTYKTTNAAGCDSTATLVLSLKPNTSSTTKDSINAGGSYIFNGNTYTVAGTYIVHLINSKGCDSAATLILSIRVGGYSVVISGNNIACTLGSQNKLSVNWSGGSWLSSNTSVATITNTGIVTAISNGTSTITYTYIQSGVTKTATKTFTVAAFGTVANITGPTSVCKGSTVTLSHNIGGGIWASLNSCAIVNASTGLVTGNGSGNTANITYTLTNAAGCKAIKSYSILCNPKPTMPGISYAIGTSNPQLGASGGFCTNKTFTLNGSPTGGVFSSSGVITVNPTTGVVNTGSVSGTATLGYTVTNVVGCANTRTITGNVVSCFSRGINNNLQYSYGNEASCKIYPNPSKNQIQVFCTATNQNGSIKIVDMLGKVVKQVSVIKGTESATINIESLQKGTYIVQLDDQKTILIKE